MSKTLKFKPSALTIELLGWFGMVEILLAYTLISLKLIEPEFLYQALNASGALLLSLNSFEKKAWPPFSLNIIWSIIGVIAIIKMLF